MKNSFHNIISLFLICSILIAAFYKYPDKDKIDFKKQIVDFTKYEDARDIDKVLSFFEFPLLEYWQHKEVAKNQLKKLYQGYWERFDYSQNEIQKIDKVSNFEFILTTKYIYSKNIGSLNSYRLSETKFKFNALGKITSITNLSLKKIDHQYIIDNNLIRDFSYNPAVPSQNNNTGLLIFLVFLIFLNLLLQIYFSNKSDVKTVKVIPTNDKNSNKVTGSYVSNEKLRDNSINSLKLKEQRELDKLNKRVEEEKRLLAVKAHKDYLINQQKIRDEKEKIAIAEELARKKRNRIARKKEAEKKRIEQEKLLAEQKQAEHLKEAERLRKARIEKEEKLKARREARRTEKARIEKEEKLKARREARRKKREQKEIEKRNIDKPVKDVVASNTIIKEEDVDEFFDDKLSQYVTEIQDDKGADDESDVGDYLTDKYLHKNLKNKFKNK